MGALGPRLDGTGLKAPPPLLQGVYYSINILAEGVQSVQRDARIAGRMSLREGPRWHEEQAIEPHCSARPLGDRGSRRRINYLLLLHC